MLRNTSSLFSIARTINCNCLPTIGHNFDGIYFVNKENEKKETEKTDTELQIVIWVNYMGLHLNGFDFDEGFQFHGKYTFHEGNKTVVVVVVVNVIRGIFSAVHSITTTLTTKIELCRLNY